MKHATVADLRNDFRRVSAWLEEGESVEIRKRGKPYALLSPVANTRRERPQKIDYMARLKEMWGKRVFTKEQVQRMRADEVEGEEG
ncbi:MAG: type II toxin-antitoxin system Phd/YefM family antitoxin [Verrucomicrobiales bacterium]